MQTKLKPCSSCKKLTVLFKANPPLCKYCAAKVNPIKHTSKKPIQPFSAKRKNELKEYTKIRKQFLTEHPTCQICKIAAATDIHHMQSKTGWRLNDTTNFLSVCRTCHDSITEFSNDAIAEGNSKSRTTNHIKK